MRKTLIPLIGATTLLLTACSNDSAEANQDGQAVDACVSYLSQLGNVTDHMGWPDGPHVHSGEDADSATVTGVAYFNTKSSGPGEYDVTCTVELSDDGATVQTVDSERKEPEVDRPTGSVLSQMRAEGIPVGNITEYLAESVAEDACKARRAGASHGEMLRIVEDTMHQWTLSESVSYLDVAYANFCPEFL